MHIPKTSGSVIEKAAAKSNITWGACHYEPWIHDTKCEPDCPSTCRIEGKFAWLVPPEWTLESKCAHTRYNTCSTFAIVRHPIERAYSFFKSHRGNYTNADLWITRYHHKWIPQHTYRYIDYILRHESFTEEFNDLMDHYNLPVRVDWVPPGLAPPLQQRTLCMLYNYFYDDFETFGYPAPEGCARSRHRM